ncbi:MAG: hypothetical protein ACRCYI_12420 [Plesiomonas shigelloides]
MASVHTPRKEMGKRAAEMLLARLQREAIAEPVLDLGYTLETGESL